jgi:hypothetical protein
MTLLFHQGALGDWVLTFPIMRALSGRIMAVSSWSKACLAAKLIDNVEPFNIEMREFTRLHAGDGPAALGPAVRELLEQATRIMSFVSDGDDAWARNVRRLAPRAKTFYVSPRPSADWPGHVSAWHRDRLERQGLSVQPVMQASHCNAGGHVLIHPGSGGRDKCWPLERYALLAQALTRAGSEVGMILGEVEVQTWPSDTLHKLKIEHRVRIVQSLEDLRVDLDAAALFVGNDSGPTHLAAEMGLPTVALFGPSCSRRWAPLGPLVSILAPTEPQPMAWLEVDEVVEACLAMRKRAELDTLDTQII